MADEKLDTLVRQEQIAEAALNLVAGQGLRRLSVAAVARLVGIVPSGVYRHFKSKDAIIEAVIGLLEKRLQHNVQAALAESDDPLERLRGILMRHIRLIREARAMPRIVFSDDVHAGRPEGKQRIVGIIFRYAAQVADVVRQGQQLGEIDPELDPPSVALLLFGVVMPAGVLWHLTDGGFDVTKHAERCWRMFRKILAVTAIDCTPGKSE